MSKKTFADLKEKERLAKQTVIIDAAERIFAAKAFNKVNIREIATEAGISHATIYRYFPDQQTLFLEAFMRGVQKILALLDRVEPTDDVAGALKEAANLFVSFLTENDHYFRMMTHFMLDGDLAPALVERLNAAQRSVIDKIEVIFRLGFPGQNTRVVSHAFFASLNGILISFRNYPGRDIEAVHAHMHVLAGRVAQRFAPR